jgi:hypothetical protein
MSVVPLQVALVPRMLPAGISNCSLPLQTITSVLRKTTLLPSKLTAPHGTGASGESDHLCPCACACVQTESNTVTVIDKTVPTLFDIVILPVLLATSCASKGILLLCDPRRPARSTSDATNS